MEQVGSDRVTLYSVWREHRDENIGFGLACVRAREGKIRGVVPGPNGMGLEVLPSARDAVAAALRRAA